MKHSRLVPSPKFYVIVNNSVMTGDDGHPFAWEDVTDAETWARKHAFQYRGHYVRVVKEVCHIFRALKLKDDTA